MNTRSGGLMNHRQKGLNRDKAILKAIENYRALETDQIRVMFFPSQQGKRKTQERLLKLYKSGKANRHRTKDNPYYYYIEKQGMINHLLSLNWVRIWLEQCKTWEKVHSFQYEQEYKVLRCDGFIAIKNTVTDKFKFYFIEMDRGTNEFDKIAKYNKMYDGMYYKDHWWVKLTDRFPIVLVVTISENRLKTIKDMIKEQNKSNLEFKVKLLSDIKKEVLA